jgi:hypothetical protein
MNHTDLKESAMSEPIITISEPFATSDHLAWYVMVTVPGAKPVMGPILMYDVPSRSYSVTVYKDDSPEHERYYTGSTAREAIAAWLTSTLMI